METYNTVLLFDNYVKLDKFIYIFLDTSPELKSKLRCDENFNEAKTIDKLYCDIRNKVPLIVTNLTHCLCSNIMELGYDFIIVSNEQQLKFSNMLSSGKGSFGREVRETQNWEKMLYSGCFNIEIPDTSIRQ